MSESKLEASREEKCPRRMVVTPEQLKSGWVEFVRDGIPNTINHDFKNPVKRRDGSYEVDEPQLGLWCYEHGNITPCLFCESAPPVETPEKLDDLYAVWPNCTVADCSNKACLGLSDTLCFPHYFNLPMKIENGEVVPVFPDEATKEECYRLLNEALNRHRRRKQ